MFDKFLIWETNNLISLVLPLFEIQIIISSLFITPKSPCSASAAWTKIEGVPVEFKVATILLEILALLPIAVIIILPFVWCNTFTTSTKLSSIFFFKFLASLTSIEIHFWAIFFLTSLLINLLYIVNVRYYDPSRAPRSRSWGPDGASQTRRRRTGASDGGVGEEIASRGASVRR